MKKILHTTGVVFLFIGCIAFLQSCEENLLSSNQTGLNITSSSTTSTFTNVAVKIISNCNHPLWMTQNQPDATGTIAFLNEPLTLILGSGSLKFSCPDAKYLRYVTNQFLYQELKYISQMSYSTYVAQSDSAKDDIFVVLQVDLKGDGVIVPLVYNPRYQTTPWVDSDHDQGPIGKNTWQTWDLFKGVWWMGPSIDPEHGGKLYRLEQWYTMYPKAKLYVTNSAKQGSIRFTVGGEGIFGTNFIGYMDDFTITIKNQQTIFDFEYCPQ